MKTVAIVQARMTSTRLPGKVLVPLAGKPMLEREIERLRRARTLDQIVIATTTNATDDPVVALAERLGLAVHRGSEDDVLERYIGAANASQAQIIARVTADCPLLDGEVVDQVVDARARSNADYASNVLERSYPRGLDVEVFTRAALDRCDREGTSKPAREHVTWFIHSERPELFQKASVVAEQDASDLRWTVDTPEDLEMVTAIYAALDLGERHVPYPELLAWVRQHPEVSRINAMIAQKTH